MVKTDLIDRYDSYYGQERGQRRQKADEDVTLGLAIVAILFYVHTRGEDQVIEKNEHSDTVKEETIEYIRDLLEEFVELG